MGTDINIIHGDAIAELAAYAGQAQLVLTSPPYADLRDYGGHAFDWRLMIDAIIPTLAPGGVLVWVVGDKVEKGSLLCTPQRQLLYMQEAGLTIHDVMVYQKSTGLGKAFGARHVRRWEYMHIGSNGPPNTINRIHDVPCKYAGTRVRGSIRERNGAMRKTKGGYVNEFTGRSNVWTFDPGYRKAHPGYPDAHQHPATFPYALARDHITTWTNPGDLVIDPMAGSGTTLAAAAELGRRAVGIEIHEPYVDLMRRRLGQLAPDAARSG